MTDDVEGTRARAVALGAAPLCDALTARVAHRVHLHDLIGPRSGRAVSGPAVTVRFLPLRPDLVDPERQSFGALAAAAARTGPPGAVLVAACGHPDQPVAGGKKLARVRALGLAGLVTDGRIRDLAEVDDLGIGAWCRGEAVRNANDVLMGWEAGAPVDLAGVCVATGDWIHADASGVVVIPARDVQDVLTAAEGIVARDADQVAETLGRAAGGA